MANSPKMEYSSTKETIEITREKALVFSKFMDKKNRQEYGKTINCMERLLSHD